MILRKISLLLCFVCLYVIRDYAQVNYQTGSAVYNLPMFSWTDSRSRLNLNMGLSYNSGNGLKVDQLASNVGQGWNLFVGGSISRIQVGEPDDQIESTGVSGGLDDLSKCPAGYLFNSILPSFGCANDLIKYPIFRDRNVVYTKRNNLESDKELDYFAFNFNGKSGLFVINKNTMTGVSLGENNLKITFTLNNSMTHNGKLVRTAISSFNIQDENGLIYKFSTKSISTILRTSYTDVDRIGQLTQPKFEGGNVYHQAGFVDNSITNPYMINGWFLTEVVDVLTQRKIIYNYQNRVIDAYGGSSIAYYQESDYIIISHNNSKTVTPSLSSITFPADDGHSIDFVYGSQRADLNGDYVLSEINVKYQNRFISKYKLNTSYFIRSRYGIPITDDQKRSARLCLKSVVQYGADLKAAKEPYLFDYYIGSSNSDDFVPSPYILLKDIWGFYNGDESQDIYGNQFTNFNLTIKQISFNQLKGLCFKRTTTSAIVLNAKNGYAKNGLLKNIDYPGGGSLSFEYEQNFGLIGGSYIQVGGVHVSKTKMIDGGHSNDCNNPIVTSYDYKNSSNQSSLWGLEMPNNSFASSSYYEPESKYWTWQGGLFGTCKFRFNYPGILARSQSIDLTAGQETMLVIGEILGWLSTATSVLNVVKVALGATGVGAIVAAILDIIFSVFSVVKTCFSTPSETKYSTVFFNADLNASNPLPVQFSRVVVTQGDGSNGSTILEFTNPQSTVNPYPIWESTNEIRSMKQRYALWAYGLPEKTILLNASGNKVKETINIYDFAKAKKEIGKAPGTSLQSCKCQVLRMVSQRSTNWNSNTPLNPPSNFTGNATSNPDLKAEVYSVYSGRVELKTTLERTFNVGSSNNSFVEERTDYEYNATNLMVNKVVTTPSSGPKLCVETKYTCDYFITSPLTGTVPLYSGFVNANLVTIPISKLYSVLHENQELPDLADKFILKEVATEFIILPSNNFKTSRTLVQRTDEPIHETLWTKYWGQTGTIHSAFKEVQKFTYDDNEQLVGIIDEGNRTLINRYDYNNKFLNCVVVNAVQNADVVSFSSFETTNLGGWLLSGTPIYNSNQSVTGSRSFTINSSISLSSSIGSNKKYKLSFWATIGSNINVGSTPVLVKSFPTINGFTFYEYEIAPNSISSISITGNGIVDELRLYPLNARMNTTTYDPLIGKTSECDDNNRISYYEYDELARLRFIKDENRNIIKMYEYNIKKLACARVYTNNEVNEIFVKSDCPVGFLGSEVTYTIPANTYFSNKSQEEVDQLVQNDLNTNGQVYANNHGNCIQIFYNDAISGNLESLPKFYTENCPVGYKGGWVNYTVPANKYQSLISKADANQKAIKEYLANGQTYANSNPICIYDNTPVWEAAENAPQECRVVTEAGITKKHLFVQLTDINPHSATYNQTKWQDMGVNTSVCPF